MLTPSFLTNFPFGVLNLAIYYTLLCFFGLQPLCGKGVTSEIDVTCNPALDDIEGEYPFEVMNINILLFNNLLYIKASMQN